MDAVDLATYGTLVGVCIAAWQLALTRAIAKTSFEDQITSHYRALLSEIPVQALLNGAVALDDDRTLGAFYRYVDLCNEQIFLRSNRRIRRPTWENWADGMRKQFQRPAFKGAWTRIQQSDTDSFQELRRAEREQFRRDPGSW